MKSHLLSGLAGALVGAGITTVVLLPRTPAPSPAISVRPEPSQPIAPVSPPFAAASPSGTAAPSQPAKPAFPSLNSPQMRSLLEAQADLRLKALLPILDLQPHQLNSLRLIQENPANPNGTVDTRGSDFKNLLSPDQRGKLAAFESKERQSLAETMANTELSQINAVVDLTEDQKDAVFAKLADLQLELFDPNTSSAVANGETDPARAVKQVMDRKRQALGGILSPDQMKSYSAQLEMIEKMTVEMMASEASPTPAR